MEQSWYLVTWVALQCRQLGENKKTYTQLLYHQCSVDWDKGFPLWRRGKNDTFICS